MQPKISSVQTLLAGRGVLVAARGEQREDGEHEGETTRERRHTARQGVSQSSPQGAPLHGVVQTIVPFTHAQ